MRTTSDSRSRWLVSTLGAVGGLVLLSACSAPVAPTPVEIQAAAVADDADRVVISTAAKPNFEPCRYCPLEMEGDRIGPNMPIDFSLRVNNTGEAAARSLPLAVRLVGADGRRLPAMHTDVAAPRPGGAVVLRLSLVVPSRTPSGRYRLEAVLDPENRLAESDESDNTWLTEEVLTVVGG